jgi:protein O-mannosyl-transferase
MGRKSKSKREPAVLRNPKRYERTASAGNNVAGALPAPSLLKICLFAATLVVAVLLAYEPACHDGFIWDDDSYVTDNQTLRDGNGLQRIWFDRHANPQYYPLVHTTFWIEYHLWGLNPLGYHVVNIALHAANVVLLLLVLRRLRVPGAFWAASLFAVHPVMVESVAWVTELKNVLSAFGHPRKPGRGLTAAGIIMF